MKLVKTVGDVAQPQKRNFVNRNPKFLKKQ